jgi:alkaline phosphatase D
MKIEAPTVGPLLGYTTESQARIWLRGDFQVVNGGYRRAFAAVRLRVKGAAKFGEPQFVPLLPHFDMTGVSVFTKLKEATAYEYQAGWFFAEMNLENLDAAQALDWGAIAPVGFMTGTAKATAARAYVVGSCRYLLRLFGGAVWDDRGDKCFRSMQEQMEAGRGIDGLVMMGDQIYADDLNVMGQDKSIDDYLSRYRTAFGQAHFKALTARVPTYMVMDDHEIEDNWPAKATARDWVTLYPAAIHSYQIYQCSHSPLYDVGKDGRLTGTLSKFWYQFQDGCCDWFVMDCRNERVWSKDAAARRMVKPAQMKALLKWLADGSGRVKVVVSSVPFFPDLKSDSDDKWCGFVPERTQILDFILSEKIPKVVFLSGDVHCSFSVELTSPQDPAFKVLSIISSSFFWPYPHMDDGDFLLKGALTSSSANRYNVGAASKVHSEDNFTRLEFDPQGVNISCFERKGVALGKPVYRKYA